MGAIFICYPATCSPNGHGSGSGAAVVDLLHDLVDVMSQADVTGHSTAPLSPSPPSSYRLVNGKDTCRIQSLIIAVEEINRWCGKGRFLDVADSRSRREAKA